MQNSQQTSSRQQNILILGGTNFMGKTLLDLLNHYHPQAHVYCINRGKIYWNDQARKYHKNYQHFIADRKEHKDTYDMVIYLQQKFNISQKNKWKAVIDFSAFRWRDIQSVLKAVGKNADKYIFISSDSVYNNQQKSFFSESFGGKQQFQQQFNIQQEYLKSKAHPKDIQDRYGYVNFTFNYFQNKLKCQLYVKKRAQVPSYCLRLPDVIGPYDNTDRFWTTMQWIRRSNQYPIPLTAEDEYRKLAFVYSVDYLTFNHEQKKENENAIVLENGQTSNQTNFQTINIGFEQSLTLQEFIRLLARKMNIQPRFTSIKYSSNNCYPSTQFGYINTDKLAQKYKFTATKIIQQEEAIEHTIKFFDQRAVYYEKQKHQMMRMLNKKIKRLTE